MSKVVFMFPGQGAQYIGMGKDFYDACEESKAVYELASKVTGLDIAKLCFEENEEINITEYTQIAMLTTEAAIYAALKKAGKEPAACAGLSLGEYGALIASGVMSMEDAFRVVRARGIFMQEAVPTGGAMAAVLGLDAKAIEVLFSIRHIRIGLRRISDHYHAAYHFFMPPNGSYRKRTDDLQISTILYSFVMKIKIKVKNLF